jgi:uncharacterized protein
MQMKPTGIMVMALTLAACSSMAPGPPRDAAGATALDADQLLIVDCLLPGQVRKIGAFATGVSPRRPARLPAYECERAGGEYALASRDPQRALNIWLPFAQQGERQAQTQVGELYERGIGSVPDYATAAQWYQRAAEQGDTRAIVNLGSLYERGLGVPRDPEQAARLFRRASGVASAPTRVAIHLIDPVVVLPVAASAGRQAPLVRLATAAARRELVGRATADAGVRGVTVNQQPVAIDAQGVFRFAPDLSGGPAALRITATDRQGNSATTAFSAVAGDAPAPSARSGAPDFPDTSFHALIIANDNYRHLDRLNTPRRDGQDMKTVLEERYGFKATLIQDATRRDIFSAFNALRDRVGPRDSVLVFYAGHGELDNATQRGYWVPVDGERHNQANWVSVADVTDQLSALPARQVLVVADSCYSGTMARSAVAMPDARTSVEVRWNDLRTVAQLRARVVLTSGGLEPVVDGGGGGRNSLFARTLLDVLRAVDEPIEASRVHEELSARFALRAQRLKVSQRPEYAPIGFAGHEAGDFVFVPRR